MSINEKPKKKVLLLNTSFYPNIGGVENSLRSLAQSLSDKNYSVDVISSDYSNLSGSNLSSNENLFGAEIYRFKSKGFFRRIFSCYKLCKALGRSENYELIISRSALTTLCSKAARIGEVAYLPPSVYFYINSPKRTGKKGYYYIKFLLNCMLDFLSLYSVKKIFVFSDEIANQVKSINPFLKVVKVFPGVDGSRFYPIDNKHKKNVRLQLGLPIKKNILLSVGRLEKVKGFDLAIKTLALLPDSYHLVIVGEGTQKENLKYLANKLKVSDKISFVDFCDKPELYYSASDYFLMTSFYETLGQVILEALASGLVVVAPKPSPTVKTATLEINNKFNNPILLCDEYDPKSLSQLIERSKSIDIKNVNLSDISWLQMYTNLKENL